MTAMPPKLSLADQVRAYAAKHSIEELRELRLKTPPNSAQADTVGAAIQWKVAEAMTANQERADAANPPSKATLASRENMTRIQLGRVEAELGQPTAGELLNMDIEAAVQAAELEFLGPDRKPKVLPVVSVTRLTEAGLDQSRVPFTPLVTFLADQGLSFHARCEALRRLARRGMPIGGRSRRPEFDAAPTVSDDVTTTNPEGD